MVTHAQQEKPRIEVLSPAGTFESLVAAAQSGADAVYFGGTRFSARHYAGNFDNDELARAIDYLHVRGVRAYLAINTLLYDSELQEALQLASLAYSLGIDALIVQDIGFARLARRLFPDLELHASTQMTVHNPQGAYVLSRLGFSRVILARELSLSDISCIKKTCGSIELEVFVHGAICFSYSGQCLFSSMVGGRSGNRGRCAQPCRLEYSLVESGSHRPARGFHPGSGHLLSTGDLCLIQCIPELIEAGVTALKIEGRMKGPEYVATVTRAYRWAVDKYIETGEIPADELSEVVDQLSAAFSRGFTKAYFYGKPAPDLMSPGRPSNRGAYIGRIARVAGEGTDQRIVVRLETDLSVGDCIDVWVSKGGRIRKTVEELFIAGKPVYSACRGDEVEIGLRGRVSAGDRVFKTQDAELVRSARQSYASPREQRQLPVKFEAVARIGCPFALSLTDSEGRRVLCESGYVVEPALRHSTTRDDIEQNLRRMGNTPFFPESIVVHMDDGAMIPKSVVNECRRECVAQLEARRAEEYRRTALDDSAVVSTLSAVLKRFDGPVPRSQEKIHRPGVSVSTSAFSGLQELADARPHRVYLSLECFDGGRDSLWAPERLREAVKLLSASGIETYIRLPRILKAHEMDHVIARLAKLTDAVDLSRIGFLVGGLGVAHAVLAARHLSLGFEAFSPADGSPDEPSPVNLGVSLHADYSFGITNSSTVNAIRTLGFKGLTLSPELNIGKLRSLVLYPDMVNEIVVHGRLPLMISEQCVVGYLSSCARKRGSCPGAGQSYGLLDRKGYVFPLLSDQFCRTYVLNSMCMCMIDCLDDLLGLPWVNLYRIEGYGESNTVLARAVRAYNNAIIGEEAPPCETLVGSCSRGFTKGHFYRGAE